jgi:hypothetical protein
MRVFDPQSFHQFLGQLTYHKQHNWGIEQRYVISETSLSKFEKLLADTLYYHHSSFDVADDVATLGFPLTAQAMHQRNSGMPTEEKTQMGNLGEVIGTEFARAFLGFETTRTFPKQLNPNIDQAMKGVDILGLRGTTRRPELLIGEAKTGKRLHKLAVEEGYDHLIDLHRKEAMWMLHSMKEALGLKGDKEGAANVDRHTADRVPRHYLLLVVTQSLPREPFNVVAERFKLAQLPRLLAVHIQIRHLKDRKSEGKHYEEDTWLTRLFSV